LFSDKLEAALSTYLIHCSKIYYGLTPSDVKVLAYEYAKSNNVAYPKNWDVNKLATKDWFISFLKRNSTSSLRLPEATSLGRVTSFNKHNVGIFFSIIYTVSRYCETALYKINKYSRKVWSKDQRQKKMEYDIIGRRSKEYR